MYICMNTQTKYVDTSNLFLLIVTTCWQFKVGHTFCHFRLNHLIKAISAGYGKSGVFNIGRNNHKPLIRTKIIDKQLYSLPKLRTPLLRNNAENIFNCEMLWQSAIQILCSRTGNKLSGKILSRETCCILIHKFIRGYFTQLEASKAYLWKNTIRNDFMAFAQIRFADFCAEIEDFQFNSLGKKGDLVLLF